jgi:proteasome lid subunit RPN8/RPN11
LATSKFPPKIELGAGVLDAIETHAYSNLTAEVGGMLVGDVVNGVTNIIGHVPATTASAEQISLTFTHDVWSEILSVVNSDFPESRIVGWYHTHPSFGLFLSQYDEFIQRNFFAEPGQVALVIDPIAGELAWFAERGKKIDEFGKISTRRGPVRRPDMKGSEAGGKTHPVKIGLIAAIAALVSGLLVWGVSQTLAPPDTTKALIESNAKNATQELTLNQQAASIFNMMTAPVLVYTFQEGDDFESIVFRFYGSDETAKVLKANNLTSAEDVKAGTMLLMPQVPNVTVSDKSTEQVLPPEVTPTPTPPSTPTPTATSSPGTP